MTRSGLEYGLAPRPFGWRSLRVTTLDRYLLRAALIPYSAFLGVVLLLLTLESLPGLLPLTSKIGHGSMLLLRLLGSLVPEYLGIGIPVGLFLATGIVLRRLSISSEMDAITTAGVSDLRMAASLVALGAVAFTLQFGVRAYAQPWGERRFDQLIRSIGSGDFGLKLTPGVFNKPTRKTTIYFDRVAGRTGDVEGVLVESPDGTFLAASGTASLDRDMRLNLVLRNGTVLPSEARPRQDVGSFETLTLSMPFDIPSPRSRPLRERLDRLSLPDLLGRDGKSPHVSRAAGAAAAARISSALLCLLLPMMALGLAMPPKRSATSIGLVGGLLLLVAYFRLSAMIEETFAAQAWGAHAAMLAAIACLCALLIRAQARGRGSVEAVLHRLLMLPLATMRRRVRPRTTPRLTFS